MQEAIQMIVSKAPESLDDPKVIVIYQRACDLYGLVHSRYITQTHHGLNMMRDRFLSGDFGSC